MSEGGIHPVQVAALEAGTIKAAGDPGSSTNPYYFLSVGRNATLYYATNSTNSTSTSYYVDDLGDVVQGITQSIAYSIQNQRNLWSTIGTNTVSAINDVWNRLGTIGGYVDGLESQMTTNNTRLGTIDTAVGNIKSKVDSIYTSIDNLEGYTDGVESSLSSIYTAITNLSFTIPQSLLDDVDDIDNKLHNDSTNNFTQSYIWGKYLNNPTGSLRTFNANGNIQNPEFNFQSRSILGGLEAIIYTIMTNNANQAMFGFGGINTSESTDDYLYSSDLSSSLLPKSSFWLNFRDFASNTSYYLSRLGFVLASDEEIAARQAAAANTSAAVSNVISSSGSGSAKPSDISGIADLKSSVSDSVSTGVNVNSIFTETGSGGHAWDWFTQGIQDELSAPSRRSNVRSNSKSSGSDTPMLDAYYHDLEKAIGFKLW